MENFKFIIYIPINIIKIIDRNIIVINYVISYLFHSSFSLLLYLGSASSISVFTFAYSKNETLFDKGPASKKGDNPGITTIEYGGEGATPGMQEK